jgi:hypothetical protein
LYLELNNSLPNEYAVEVPEEYSDSYSNYQPGPHGGKGVPGFEFALVACAVVLVIVLRRRK